MAATRWDTLIIPRSGRSESGAAPQGGMRKSVSTFPPASRSKLLESITSYAFRSIRPKRIVISKASSTIFFSSALNGPAIWGSARAKAALAVRKPSFEPQS